MQKKSLILHKMMNFSYTTLEIVGSTNVFLQERPEKERVGMAVRAVEQTAGKGMGNNGWESAPGMNLTFSMGLDLSFLKAADQFLLSEAVPLGLLEVLDPLVPDAGLQLKWPNDLVCEGRKLCGILINSTIHGAMMGTSVIGVGLNVNQMEFQPWPTRPVSLKRILGREVDLDPLWHQLVESIARQVEQLRTPEGITQIQTQYLNRMYRYRQWADYEVKGNPVRRFITGIDAFGRLLTMTESGETECYDVKQIRFN